MKFIPLHTTNTAIIYKNAICSTATLLVLLFLVLSVMIPIIMVSLLSPYSGIAESRVLYEQPKVKFHYQSIFMGQTETNELVACSTIPKINEAINPSSSGDQCDAIKYWTEDMDHDGTTDRIHFIQQLVDLDDNLVAFDIALRFEAKLKHKCSLEPPAVLAQTIHIPYNSQFRSGHITIYADLVLKQYVEFTCPFPGRYTKTKFRHLNLTSPSLSLQEFRIDSILDRIKSNPAFFQLDIQEIYYREQPFNSGLTVQIDLEILQLGARYHLSVWERLGQFWLYFASFFGVSFYIMNKLKDYLFGHHIVRSWEIIPWKKLY